MQPAWACSDDAAAWQAGARTFNDPLPRGSGPTQLLLTVWGLGCPSDRFPQLQFAVNGRTLLSRPFEPMGQGEQGCGCPNCHVAVPMISTEFVRSVPSWHAGGLNTLRVTTSDPICLSHSCVARVFAVARRSFDETHRLSSAVAQST